MPLLMAGMGKSWTNVDEFVASMVLLKDVVWRNGVRVADQLLTNGFVTYPNSF